MAAENKNENQGVSGWGSSLFDKGNTNVQGLDQLQQQFGTTFQLDQNGTTNVNNVNGQKEQNGNNSSQQQPQQQQNSTNQPNTVQEWGFPPPESQSQQNENTQNISSNNGQSIQGWSTFAMDANKTTQNEQQQLQSQSQIQTQSQNQNQSQQVAGWGNLMSFYEADNNNNDNTSINNNESKANDSNNSNMNNNNNNMNNSNNIDNKNNEKDEHKHLSTDEFFRSQNSGIDPTAQGKVTMIGVSGVDEQYQSKNYPTFASMGVLNERILSAISYLGWVRPSKIQASILPMVLEKTSQDYGRDVIAQAHHGSGKTGTFILNMLEKIDLSKKTLQALVICHTRELATQTKQVAIKLGRTLEGLEIVLAVPPRDKKNPEKSEKVPSMSEWRSQVCIGTPGVILFNILGYDSDNDCLKNGNEIKSFLKDFKTLVIDEADEFLGDDRIDSNNFRGRGRGFNNRGRGRGGRGGGFGRNQRPRLSMYDQLEKIAKFFMHNAPRYQTMLFSATFPKEILKLTKKFGCKNPFQVLIEKTELGLKNIKNIIVEIADVNKRFETLADILLGINVGQVIVFTNSVHCTRQLQDKLKNNNDFSLECSLMIGQMSNKERDSHMDAFRLGESRILIASNVIARGIDVPQVNLVVNYEIPFMITDNNINRNTVDSATYMHRVGRTGRYGKRGICINFVDGGRSSNLLNQALTMYDLKDKTVIIQANNKQRKQVEKEIVNAVGDWITSQQ